MRYILLLLGEQLTNNKFLGPVECLNEQTVGVVVKYSGVKSFQNAGMTMAARALSK